MFLSNTVMSQDVKANSGTIPVRVLQWSIPGYLNDLHYAGLSSDETDLKCRSEGARNTEESCIICLP